MNKVFLSGRLTKDILLRYAQSGMAFCTFSLALERGFSKQKRQEAEENNRQLADFIRISVWGKQAENASRYLQKGSKCLVEGKIQTGSYYDRESGKKIYTTDVIADRLEFLDRQNKAQDEAYANNYENEAYYMPNKNNFNTGQTMGDFYEDDFKDLNDDGAIPF